MLMLAGCTGAADGSLAGGLEPSGSLTVSIFCCCCLIHCAVGWGLAVKEIPLLALLLLFLLFLVVLGNGHVGGGLLRGRRLMMTKG